MKSRFFICYIRHIWKVFLVILCRFVSPLSAQPPFADLDKYIEKGMLDWQIPGMAVAVVKEGKIVYSKGYGIKEKGRSEKVDTETVFAIGSNTKAFTAMALSLLEYERKFNLDSKVRQYFPDFQLQDSLATLELTFRDLLLHRIGIDTWYGDFTHWGSKYTKPELIQRMRFLPTSFPIRTHFGYCNVGYMLAGEAIPKVAKGKTWEQMMQERFFQPLQMNRTCTSTSELPALGNVATPHTLYRKQLITLPWRNIDNLAACGSINSTVTDMSHWLIAQMDSGRYDRKSVFPSTVILQSHTPQMPLPAIPYRNPKNPTTHFQSYGLGWFLRDYQGKMMIYHSGAVDGMTSITAMLPEERWGLVILTNSDAHGFLSPLMFQMIDGYLKIPYKNWNENVLAQQKEADEEKSDNTPPKDANNRPSLPLSKYAGYYFHSHYGQITIRMENQQLTVYPSAHPTTVGKLSAWNGDYFVCEWTDKMWDKSHLDFVVENGEVLNFDMITRPDLIDPSTYNFIKIGDAK